MYSPFKLAIKYLQYYLTAFNGKGHGIHSPFVFNFIEKVLNDKNNYNCYDDIEKQRKRLLQNNTLIDIEDLGAGSAVITTNRRIVSKVAASSLKTKKYAQLLFRLVQYYKPITIIELGTSFGITTAYLAHANPNAQVFTCEGAKEVAHLAQENFLNLKLENVTLIQGNFATTLPLLLAQLKNIDFAFIDGNHRYKPTIDYFEQLLKRSQNETIFVFDDIHWSSEMEAAWREIQHHEEVTLTIDLFFIGIVCVNKAFKAKQHFTIRY